MRSKQVIKRFLLAILLGGPVLGAQAQSTGPLVGEERGSGGGRASSCAPPPPGTVAAKRASTC
jgi:hypothetical protein